MRTLTLIMALAGLLIPSAFASIAKAQTYSYQVCDSAGCRTVVSSSVPTLNGPSYTADIPLRAGETLISIDGVPVQKYGRQYAGSAPVRRFYRRPVATLRNRFYSRSSTVTRVGPFGGVWTRSVTR